MVLLHSSESLGLRMWPVEFMKSSVNKYIKMWSFRGCFSQLLFSLLSCYLFFSAVQPCLFPLGTGAESWGLAAGSPQSGWAGPTSMCSEGFSLQTHLLRRKQTKEGSGFLVGVQRCCTCCGWGLHHPTALWWWSSLPCFLWRSLLTMDFFPYEKWKRFCCSSSPLGVFNGRCAAAALESLRSPLLSHHRETHVGLKSLLRDSWTWTWLLLCLLWMKAKSQSALTKLVLQ